MSKVLVIGEREPLADRLRQTTRGADVQLETVGWAHWRRALAALRPSDAALLDLTAPDAPGLPQLEAYQAQQPSPRLLYVIGIDLVEAEPLQRLIRLPGVDFIRSPVDAGEVAQRLLRLLGGSTARRRRPHAVAARRRHVKVGRRNSHTPAASAIDERPDDALLPPAGSHADSAARIVAPAFRHLVPELHHSASGRLDARRVGSWFGLSVSEMARVLGRKVSTVHKTPDAVALQPELAAFERIAAALWHLAGSTEAARIWLNAPNPELEDETPANLIRMGEAEIVAELLEDVLMGQPS